MKSHVVEERPILENIRIFDMQYWKKLSLIPPTSNSDSLFIFCSCNLYVVCSYGSLCFCFSAFFFHVDLQKGKMHCCKSNLQSVSDCFIFHTSFGRKMKKIVYISHHAAKYFKNITVL